MLFGVWLFEFVKMPVYYTYFIATLPTLSFREKPPFSYAEFLNKGREFISAQDLETLKKISSWLERGPKDISLDVLKRWYDFDILLRNALVKLRAARKHQAVDKYLRPQKEEISPYAAHIALNAHKNPSLLEAEISLDDARWRFLDDLSFGHYFDRDFLIVYGLKLLISERWERIKTLNKEVALEELLGKA